MISLAGALCYAELASTYPTQGGEYHYMTRAFGTGPGFLFVWARLTVIQTGSIAMLAFLIGDYLAETFSQLPLASPHYAALTVLLVTAVNLIGIRQGKQVQWSLIIVLLFGLGTLIVTGSLLRPAAPQPFLAEALPGKAMIFVLLTFGGWNEAAYLSAEVRGSARNMLRVLVGSIALVTLLYLAVNLALLRGLGQAGMSGSDAVAADLMRLAVGEGGARLVSLLVVTASLSTMNATMITGARSGYALGRDFPRLGFLGRWQAQRRTPVNALLAQGGIALLLVAAGSWARNGFEAMVAYTAPVFWFFFFLVGLSLFVLRRKEPSVHRPFRVPLYPLLPLFFCAVCLAMLMASLAFTGVGALVGGAVLLTGIPLLLLVRPSPTRKENPR
ncbi:MAG: APC family permease [Desulfuromonadales bacterium]|nr:APC family permease [Desulfuromonadales bacterium]